MNFILFIADALIDIFIFISVLFTVIGVSVWIAYKHIMGEDE